MGLITPGIGLLFWMLLTFTAVLFILKKFAWVPILKALKSREDSIDNALNSAEKARQEVAKLKANNDKVLAEARQERALMLKEARETQDRIVADAKDLAKIETDKMLKQAQLSIEQEKNAAVESIREEIVTLSIQVAEKILKKELSQENKQSNFVNELVKDIHLN